MTAPVFCSFLYASRNPHASMVQPGVSALGKKNSTTVLPRKSFSDTCWPFWSGNLKSGAFSLASMFLSRTCQPLYRRAGRIVIPAVVLALGLLPGALRAQFSKGPKRSTGPRALALLQVSKAGANLVPIAIMVNGQFYDASAYKADPRPMALDYGVVYEAEQTGKSLGLFTVGNAQQVNGTWYGFGQWQTETDLQKAREAKAVPPPKKRNDDEDDKPPVLRRPGSSASQPPSTPPAPKPPESQKPTGGPTTSAPPSSTPPSATKPANTAASNAPAEVSTARSGGRDDSDRPILRRGRPAVPQAEPDMDAIVKANSAGNSGKPAPAAAKPDIQLIPAISDADGPEPRSFAWQLKAGEEQQFTKQLQGFARADVAKFEKQRLPNFASVELDPGNFRVFDVDLSNEPTFVYVAPARIFTGVAPTHTRARPRTTLASMSEIQAYVTVVAKMDLYGE